MPEPQSDLEALERFVAENDDLLGLEEAIGRFNIFDALGIARAEIRHSNFLAWLLDPAESHGQGDLFLKAVLMDLLRQTPPQRRPLSPVQLDGVSLEAVEVRREWPARTDLCISCRSPSFVVAFENKVDSGEHGDQLARCKKAICAEFPDRSALYVFLTATGAVPSDDGWGTYRYADIHRVFSRVRRTAGGSLGGDVGTFLDHYLGLIGSQFMDDPKLVDLCRRIYANHRRAIDLIIAHAPTQSGEALTPITEWLAEHPETWVVRSSGRAYCTFVPRHWVGKISEPSGQPLPAAACDMFLECSAWSDDTRASAYARLIVGPATDQAKRITVIERLKEQPFALRMQKKKPTEVWTRLGSKTLARWPVDAEVPAEKLVEAFEAWLRGLEPAIDGVPDVLASVTA